MFEGRSLWYVAPRQVETRVEQFTPAEGELVVRAEWSGVSRGTERLVLDGRVPESEYERMRAPFQSGAFPYPVKYGYAAVGIVEHGPSPLRGARVFALHPHQTRFTLPASAALLLPPDLPPRRAVLAANMETALNAVWDSGAAPGDRIAVVGGGALGLLTASLLSRLPGAEVFLVDIFDCRRPFASAVDVKFTEPSQAPVGCDIAFHASASAAGLATAMQTLGPEGALVEMSWHGAGETAVALGGAFHAKRLRIISTQVGSLPPARRPRWDRTRRLAKALDILAGDARLDALITDEIPFADAPRLLPDALAPDAPGVATAIRYD